MLKLDCLLINTEVAETVKKLIGYLGHKGIAEDKDVSFRSMYNELRKNGIEIDLESAAHIYEDALPLEDARFTPAEDLEFDTGRWFDNIVRAITLQKPKIGEKEIGELSPAQAVVKGYSDAFNHNVSEDHTTKSIMKTLEDVYRQAGRRLLGELPNDATGKDTRTSAEIIQKVLDNENLGYRNTVEGTINGLAKIHDEVKSKVKELTAEMEATGDQDKIDQWNAYAKSLEDAAYTLMFTSPEAKAVLHTSMRDAGFTKRTKTGTEVIDWQKLAGHVNSYDQLRKNVVESVKKAGFGEDIGHRVADSMTKEFRDIRGKILETADKEQQRLKDTWNKQNNPRNPHSNIIDERLKRWENYKLLAEDDTKPLVFAKSEANRIVSQAIKDLGYTKQVNGKDVIDYEKLADDARSKYDIPRLVTKILEQQGYDHATAQEVSGSVKEMNDEFFTKVKDYVTAREAKTEATWLQQNGGPKQQQSLKDLIELRKKQSGQHSQIVGTNSGHFSLKKHEGQRILNETLRAGDFGMDTADGKRIDWSKLAQLPPTEAQLMQMVADHLQAEGVSPYDANVAAGAIKDVYSDLSTDIQDHSQSILDARQQALDRESPRRRTDLHRLAELHDLGIFNGSHDRLLAHTLGIEESDVQAIQAVKKFAESLSNVRRVLAGNDFIVPTLMHTINREIHNIIAPLIENKTKTMKAISIVNKVMQVENSMLIVGHNNLIENHLSGGLELLTTMLNNVGKLGSGLHEQDRQLMKDVWSHIAAGGVEQGLSPDQVGGTKMRVTDEYNIHKMRGADWSKPATWGRALATAAMTIPRTGLSAADGMFKVGNMSMHVKSGVIDVMRANDPTLDKETAIQMYNDAIYGPGQLTAAKLKAENLYKSAGMKYVSQKELNIVANEVLRENLIQNRLITADELQDVMKNAWHQAGLGMGHESNNLASQKIQAFKQSMNKQEQEALSENKWSKAASLRLRNTLVGDVILRFAASRFNWAYIRLEQAGMGIITGPLQGGKAHSELHKTGLIKGIKHFIGGKEISSSQAFDPEQLKELAVEYQAGRQKMYRGMLGLGASFAGYLAIKAIANAMNPDDEDPTEAMFAELKDNYPAKSLFLKTAPLWQLQQYYYNTDLNGSTGEKEIFGLLQSTINLSNVGDRHDISVQMFEAAKLIGDKSQKQRDRGMTKLGQAFNNYIPHVPLLKQGKNVMQFASWVGGGAEKPMPPYPDNFMQGLLYGGIIQDACGMFPAESLPESLQDWGQETEAPAK